MNTLVLLIRGACFLIALCLLLPKEISAQNLSHDGCNKWESSVRSLNDKDRNLLRTYGVIRRKEWVFSETLIRDCELRAKMAWYFEHIIQGHIDASVVRFGWMHYRSIDSVIRRVWPSIGFSEAVPSDGSFTVEAWALLRQPWLSSEAFEDILDKEVKKHGLSPDAAFTLLNRPVLAIRPTLSRLIDSSSKEAATDTPFIERVSALVLLDILGDTSAVHRLRELSTISTLNEVERSTLQMIVEKIDGDEPVLWRDLEPLVSEW